MTGHDRPRVTQHAIERWVERTGRPLEEMAESFGNARPVSFRALMQEFGMTTKTNENPSTTVYYVNADEMVCFVVQGQGGNVWNLVTVLCARDTRVTPSSLFPHLPPWVMKVASGGGWELLVTHPSGDTVGYRVQTAAHWDRTLEFIARKHKKEKEFRRWVKKIRGRELTGSTASV